MSDYPTTGRITPDGVLANDAVNVLAEKVRDCCTLWCGKPRPLTLEPCELDLVVALLHKAGYDWLVFDPPEGGS
jgi:2-keto-3-deoxy-L-rhamnonate aldolase RhmA